MRTGLGLLLAATSLLLAGCGARGEPTAATPNEASVRRNTGESVPTDSVARGPMIGSTGH